VGRGSSVDAAQNAHIKVYSSSRKVTNVVSLWFSINSGGQFKHIRGNQVWMNAAVGITDSGGPCVKWGPLMRSHVIHRYDFI
jgi:hypothetical protein